MVFGKGGAWAIDLVDQQAKLCGEARERTECHKVNNGEYPGVFVAKDIDLLTEVRLDGHVFESEPCDGCRHQCPRHQDDSGVMDKDFITSAGMLWRDEGDAQQPKSHDPRAKELDEGDTKVANAGLQAQRCSGQALGEEVPGRGHEAREDAAADAADK